MKKRVLAVAMSMIFTLGMLSGCGSSTVPASASPAVSSAASVASTAPASTEASSEASTEAAVSLTSPAVGVLMDAAMHSYTVKFPVYVGIDDGVTVKDADEFQKLDAVEAGIVVGGNSHTLIFSKDGQGITGINP